MADKRHEVAIVKLRAYVDEDEAHMRLYTKTKLCLDTASAEDVLNDTDMNILFMAVRNFYADGVLENPLSIDEFKKIIFGLDTEFPRYKDVRMLSFEAFFKGYEQKAVARAIMDAYKNGNGKDKEWAAEAMTRLLDGFIGALIKRYNAGVADEQYEDLHQEGRLALIEAMPMYDPEWSLPTTYFAPHITHAITRFQTRQLMGITGHQATLAIRVKRAVNELKKEGLEPTVQAIVEKCNMDGKKEPMTARQVRDALQIMHRANLSYIAEQEHDDRDDLESGVFGMQDSATDRSPEKSLLRSELAETVKSVFDRLDPEMAEIVLYVNGFRFTKDGLIPVKKMSFTNIAKKLTEETGKTYTTHGVTTLHTRAQMILRSNPQLRKWKNALSYKTAGESITFSFKSDPNVDMFGAELDPVTADAVMPEFLRKQIKDVLFTL